MPSDTSKGSPPSWGEGGGGDGDCEALSEEIVSSAYHVSQIVTSRLLSVKGQLTSQALQKREEMAREHAAAITSLSLELEEGSEVQSRLLRDLSAARDLQLRLAAMAGRAKRDAEDRMMAGAVLNEWLRAIPPLRREAWAERQPNPHYRRVLFVKIISAWRSAARKERQAKIDEFWQGAVEQLKSSISQQYELQLDQLRAQLLAEKQRTEDAWRAHAALGQNLKSAFMRGVCQLNLQVVT
ncbi:MAG: hypothetical protein SGPRY_012369 [Prymnesium sp.]